MANAYIVPIETVWAPEIERAPRYMRSEMYPSGVDGMWSLIDFGSISTHGILITDALLSQPDVFVIPDDRASWNATVRANLRSKLSEIGLEDRGWIAQAAEWRGALHRLIGMAQVMQSAIDDPFTAANKQDPSKWLGREIYCGNVIIPAYDKAMFASEQKSLAEAQRLIIGDWELRGLFWVNARTGQQVPAIRGAALPNTDNFTTASDQGLTTYSANWTYNTGTFTVRAATDDCEPASSGAREAAHYNTDTYNNDQYAQVVLNSVGFSPSQVGSAVRCDAGGAATYYDWRGSNNGGSTVSKVVSGTRTVLGSTGPNLAATDVIRLEVSGTTLTPKINGALSSPPGTQTDSSISSGKGGISGFSTGTDNRLDDFEGGNLAAAAASLLSNERMDRFQTMLVR